MLEKRDETQHLHHINFYLTFGGSSALTTPSLGLAELTQDFECPSPLLALSAETHHTNVGPISAPTTIHLPFLINIFFPVWYEPPSFSVALFYNAFPVIQETNPHDHTTTAEAGVPPVEVNSKILVIKRETEYR